MTTNFNKYTKILIKNQFLIQKLTFKLINNIFIKVDYSIIKNHFQIIFSLWRNNGFIQMIKYMKSVRLHITRYICGKPLLINKDGVSLDRDGFPKRFSILKTFLNEPGLKSSVRVKRLRIILTLLMITRGLNPLPHEQEKIKVNLLPITEEFSGTRQNPVPTWFIKEFVKYYKLSVMKPTYDENSYYLSPKGGPMGKSTWSSIWSMYALSNDLILSIQYFLGTSFKTMFYDKFLKNMEITYGVNLHPKKWPSGKLGLVRDPEGKLRVIAMVDYHSQLVLRSIHDKLLEKLRNLPCDRTYTQSPFAKWEENSENYFSLDLSSATDRFPVTLQARLLSEMFSDQNFGKYWVNLLLNRDYLCPGEQPGGDSVRYAVGQPMGAYSSWAAFTLTHHLVVAWCAHKKTKKLGFNQYIILGDDIVLKDNDIAMKYIGIMSKLGVEISKPKTHISKDTYEFAKRWIHKGVEISGLPMKGILMNIHHLRRVYTILFDYIQRIPTESNQNSLVLFAKSLSGIKFGKRIYSERSLIRILNNYYITLRYSYGVLTPYELREYILNRFNTGEEIIPSDKRILDWFKGVICDGVAGKVSTLARGYTADVNKLESFKKVQNIGVRGGGNQLEPLISFELDFKKIAHGPLLPGMYNHINKLSEKMREWMYGDVKLDEIIQEFTLPSADSLSRKDRDINLKIDELDSLIFKSLKRHFDGNPFPDHFYGERSNGDRYLYPGLCSLDVNVNPRIGFEVKSPMNMILNTEINRLKDSLSMLKNSINRKPVTKFY
uniref:RNA-dependent RNA polymerase n=1 Tax=Unuamitovirus cefi 1 TaxID=3030002 RepID=A0A9N6YK13_9VIRU|nr:TPA_asm: RNA-dependent RNA polymerase [Unuamitovirus cefi 1]